MTNNTTQKTRNLFLLIVLACFFTLHVTAQGTLPDDPDEGVPLDGGLCLGAIGAIGYGVHRLKKRQMENAIPKHLRNRSKIYKG